jgi:hypothetical protein
MYAKDGYESSLRQPHHLHLQLLCNKKTRVKDSLDIWPPLPIVLSYESDYVKGDQNVIVHMNTGIA